MHDRNIQNWTAREDQFLREYYSTGSIASLSRSLNRTANSVKARLRRLGLSSKKSPGRNNWLATDLTHLRRLVDRGYTNATIGNVLGRSVFSVQAARTRLGIATRQPRTQHRDCLSCNRPFRSKGVHNRICGSCKGGEEWLSGGIMSTPEAGSRLKPGED